MRDFIIIDNKDNVATALRDLAQGEIIHGISMKENIASGHKFALEDIKEGQGVIKYSQVIALASAPISAGSWVHIHNTSGLRARGDKDSKKDKEQS